MIYIYIYIYIWGLGGDDRDKLVGRGPYLVVSRFHEYALPPTLVTVIAPSCDLVK
jgi:hypothetical protein